MSLTIWLQLVLVALVIVNDVLCFMNGRLLERLLRLRDTLNGKIQELDMHIIECCAVKKEMESLRAEKANGGEALH